MPAASEINACCPTSLTLPKQPEDSADGFNGLLLSMFITAQICHVNTNFLKFRQCRDPAATIKTCTLYVPGRFERRVKKKKKK